MSMSRKNLNKNAISAFEEYGVVQRRTPKVEVTDQQGPAHKPIFFAEAKLGDEVICREQGNSKHDARIKAAERALQQLHLKDSKAVNGTSEVTVVEDETRNPVPYKDPVSALMEYTQSVKMALQFEQVSQEGPPHMPIFTMVVRMGDRCFRQVKGSSIKEVKKRSACVALNVLKSEGKLASVFPDTQLPPKTSKTKPSLGTPGKNPVSVLNELSQKFARPLKFESRQDGPPHKPVFTVTAVFGDERYPSVEASSKQEGKALAAGKVLSVLTERGQYAPPEVANSVPNSIADGLSHHDKMATAALHKVDELLVQTPESLVGRKVVAAIIMTDDSTQRTEVVSVGSGNRCVRGSLISDTGDIVHDSHAEILARRGFKRYLYWLLQSNKGNILEKTSSGRWTFSRGISFHLYISTAPCGDGALFSHNNQGPSVATETSHSPTFTNRNTQGLLRAKQENGEGTIPIENDFAGQTYDGIKQGGRLRIMSCSDKICQWNVLGLQGALLSRWLDPVYLKSVTLGSLFHVGHLSRALCCRVDHNSSSLNNDLPTGYSVNHPSLGLASSQDSSRAVEKARPLSINWSLADTEVEVTDATTGMTVKTMNSIAAPSRVSKNALLQLYRGMLGQEKESNMTYRQLKLGAIEYCQAKLALHTRFLDQGFGLWVHMPKEVDRFL